MPATPRNITELHSRIAQHVECKIHGGYFSLPLVSVDDATMTAVVQLPEYHGSSELRVLPIVSAPAYRGWENCIIVLNA